MVSQQGRGCRSSASKEDEASHVDFIKGREESNGTVVDSGGQGLARGQFFGQQRNDIVAPKGVRFITESAEKAEAKEASKVIKQVVIEGSNHFRNDVVEVTATARGTSDSSLTNKVASQPRDRIKSSGVERGMDPVWEIRITLTIRR